MTDGPVVRDRDRAAVYAAEDQWSALLDRGGPVEFFGSRLDVAPQVRFGSLAAMQAYVDGLGARSGRPGVRVRDRRGQARAHYADGVIAVPADAAWACRESVLLHEFAHHLVGAAHRHDGCFRAGMIGLVESELGPQAALLLRAGYEAQELPVVPDVH